MADWQEKLAGVFAPLTTPFRDDIVDWKGIEKNLERLNRSGLKGYFALGTANVNNIQRGVSVGFSHRATPTVSLDAIAAWSRISALEGAGDGDTQEAGARVWMRQQLAPRTFGLVGVRARKIGSNVAISGREIAAFAGLDHGF